MSQQELKLQENFETSKVLPIRKGLDGPVVEEEDWLTPLAPGTEFVVCPVYSPSTYHLIPVFLDFYRKICSYNSCAFLIEERDDIETPRYVIPKAFCNKYKLVEILHVE